jgi:hypothetical protein
MISIQLYLPLQPIAVLFPANIDLHSERLASISPLRIMNDIKVRLSFIKLLAVRVGVAQSV